MALGAPMLTLGSELSSYSSVLRKRTTGILIVGLVFSLLLSFIGGTGMFLPLWTSLPEFLKIFREPWQKFIPIYLVFLYSLISISCAGLNSKLRKPVFKCSFISATVCVTTYLALPALSTFHENQPDQISFHSAPTEYWRQLSKDLKSVENYLEQGEYCVRIVDRSTPGAALVELRLWRFVSSTPRLRTLSINYALVELRDIPANCSHTEGQGVFIELKSDTRSKISTTQMRESPASDNCSIFNSATLRLFFFCRGYFH